MPCVLLLIALIFPRVVLVLLWIFSNWLENAYHGLLLPLLGLVFLPVTTLAYAWMYNSQMPISGANLLWLLLAVLIDLGSLGGGGYRRARR